VKRPKQRSEKSLDVPTHMRLRDRTVFERDAVLFGSAAQHFAMEFFGVVEVDACREAPARPLPDDAARRKPSLFR